MQEKYRLPPRLTDESGRVRRAGFEFEFGNLPIAETADALHRILGGKLEQKSPFEAVLHDSSLGRLKVERDFELLKSVRYRRWLESVGLEFSPGSLGHEIETNIDHASRLLIPCEVVTDPLPLDRLSSLDSLVEALESLNAEGTQHSLFYAFGLHINPSIPDSSAQTLLRYLQAFLLLYTWILDSSDIDKTRRFLTRFIDPFPQDYAELILDNDYQANADRLIGDYLQHNPTRNRALDMLPIFCELDRERVMRGINQDEGRLVKGRPAFHYRLPDCRVNQLGWSAASAWNRWVYVETVAEDEALLAELIDAWRASNATYSVTPGSNWSMRLTTLLAQKYLER